jgi:hypothetical protein
MHQKGDKSIWGPERPDERDIFEVEGEGIPPTMREIRDAVIIAVRRGGMPFSLL